MSQLSPIGRQRYHALQTRIAQTYGVKTSREEFNVEPSLAQTLNDQITLSSAFLQRINVIGVNEIKGEKVMMGVNGTVTGRTDTDKKTASRAMCWGWMARATSCTTPTAT